MNKINTSSLSKICGFAMTVLLLSHVLSHVLSHAQDTNATTWEQILTEKKIVQQDSSYLVITEQYAAYAQQQAPVVAHPIIKSITIIENNEPIIDIKLMQNKRINMLPDAPSKQVFVGPMYNSGLPSASKMRLGIWQKLERVLANLDNLAESFGYKPGKISIKVFEGLRDIETQKKLFMNKFDEIKRNNPSMSDDMIESETAKWVSPFKNNIPVHATGAAVDIRLWNDETNDFVDLGPFGVIWGTNKEAQTFSENLSDHQKFNRLYLLMATAKAGLVNYAYEYWHYSAGDRYAVYWQEKNDAKRCACYGLIQ